MYRDLEKSLARAAYTIKGGEIVVKDGVVTATPLGSTFWVDSKIPEKLEAEVMKEIEADFDKYYTVGFRNYPVEDTYLPTGDPVVTKGRWAQ